MVSDSALWKEITRIDTTLNIGLKLPGSARGVVRGTAQLDKASWMSFAHAVTERDGIRVIHVDSSRFPLVTVKVKDLPTLAAIRRLPFVDYAEPVHLPITYFGEEGCTSGSFGGSSSTDSPYGGPFEQIVNVFGGRDVVASPFYDSGLGMNILNAWKLTGGQGLTLGITDTGLDTTAGSEFHPGTASSGSSAGRWVKFLADQTINMSVVLQGPSGPVARPTCSHGTRMAGLASAPRNGRSVVGVAWLSNLLAYYQDDSFDPARSNAGRGIDSAVANGAKVIVMAWGMATGSDLLDGIIDDHYNHHDVMFVGAAGTCPIGTYCPRMESAVFPASKGDVLAVTAAAHDGHRPGTDFFYGIGKGGVTSYTDLATTELRSATIVNLGGTSGATAIVGGIAALVRAYNPQMTNRQVMDRLIYTAGYNCSAPSVWSNSLVDASAAVGGPCVSRLHNSYFDGQYIMGLSPSPVPMWVNVFTTFGVNHLMLPPGGPFPGASDPYPPGPHTLGGSGSYHVDWTIPPGAVAVGSPASSNITDYQSGDTFWQQAWYFNIKPAVDGAPYMAIFKVNVTDNALGTIDTRIDSVLVCPSSSNCARTTRPWPAFAYINGPSWITAPGMYTWTATYQGPNESYSIQWEVSYDGGNSWSLFSQGSSASLYFGDGESDNLTLRTTVTTQTGATGQSGYGVMVNTAGCSMFIIC